VRVLHQEVGLSERRACGLMDIERASVRYAKRERNDGELRGALRNLAAARLRFGYRRLWAMLRRECGCWRG